MIFEAERDRDKLLSLWLILSNRLPDAALVQLDGVYQALWRGDPGALHVGEEKS